MIRMVDVYNDGEWIAPKSLCKTNINGRIEFQGCPGCEEYHKKINENEPLGCEMDDCEIYRIFEEYAELTNQCKSSRRMEDFKMNNMLNGMFGKVQPGMCRLSMSGGIAVKTENGYKSYSVKSGRLTNCDSFVFNIGEEFFFVIPTNKAEVGDIILVSGKPKCVIEAKKNMLTVINYEDSTVENILPERHVFMGNTYFYGKIVSMFGNAMIKGKKGTNKIMQYMMMSEMMKGNGTGNGESGMSSMLPFMMMGGNMGNMFDGMFDFDDEEDVSDSFNE